MRIVERDEGRAGAAPDGQGRRPLGEAVAADAERMLGLLGDWVRIPSVAGDPELRADVARSAEWLAARCRDAGFPVAEVVPTGDSFAVIAEWCHAPGAPTVLVYSHHDVRAVREANWTVTAPFAPLRAGGRLYGRGASDAKGQVIAHLWGLRAHLAATGRAAPAVNLKLLIEGEEEMGSPHLAELLEARRARLAADVVVFSDTLQWSRDQPALCTSVRGMIGAQIEVRGPERDTHSGAVSGAAPNPILELCALLASLHDDEGRIALPGFADAVAEPAGGRAEYAGLDFDGGDWLERSGTRRVAGESGATVFERLWARPAIEVISIAGGDADGLPRAVIPATARAELSIRTVPPQRCDDVAAGLREFVAERFPDPARVSLEISEHTSQEPYRTPDHPAVGALARAMAAGHGVAAVPRMGNAGGGPAELLARVLDAPVLFYGTGLVEDRWHADDESADPRMLEAGAATIAALWSELGDAAVPAGGDSADSR